MCDRSGVAHRLFARGKASAEKGDHERSSRDSTRLRMKGLLTAAISRKGDHRLGRRRPVPDKEVTARTRARFPYSRGRTSSALAQFDVGSGEEVYAGVIARRTSAS